MTMNNNKILHILHSVDNEMNRIKKLEGKMVIILFLH
uniref:Uncharacterized protein n=1 Tax=Arundo donax TaxID=35708 RepID=A0A0A8ZVZ7_ARUDO